MTCDTVHATPIILFFILKLLVFFSAIVVHIHIWFNCINETSFKINIFRITLCVMFSWSQIVCFNPYFPPYLLPFLFLPYWLSLYWLFPYITLLSGVHLLNRELPIGVSDGRWLLMFFPSSISIIFLMLGFSWIRCLTWGFGTLFVQIFSGSSILIVFINCDCSGTCFPDVAVLSTVFRLWFLWSRLIFS